MLLGAQTVAAQSEDWAILNEQALALFRQEKYTEALTTAERARAFAVAELGDRHPSVALSDRTAGLIQERLGNLVEAERHFAASVALLEEVLGEDDPSVAVDLGNLARMYRSTGHVAQAAPLLERILYIQERAPEVNALIVAQSQMNLADAYLELAQADGLEEAQELLRRALAIRESELGPTHLAVASVHSALGDVYWMQDRLTDAHAAWSRTLEIREEVLGPLQLPVAESLENLARVLWKTGRAEEAAELEERAAIIRNRP